MNPAAKLAGFGMVLVLALGGGTAVGDAVGPIDSESGDVNEHDEHESSTSAPGSQKQGDGAAQEETMPAGVLISQDGYTLDAEATTLDVAADAPFTFRITGPDGAVVRDFVENHEKELHLILVRSDLGTYAHLHPERDEAGTWSADLPELVPGVYRAFADFAVEDGPELTLGIDVAVAGDATFAPLPPVAATSQVDGYEVSLSGSPVAGAEADLSLTVSRSGEPVTDLEPYLGAFGHLVAIRAGDLAYLHVHPLGDEPGAGARGGPEVQFAVHVPSPGDYRLFFDFSQGGTVHTAAFTVEVTESGTEAHGGH